MDAFGVLVDRDIVCPGWWRVKVVEDGSIYHAFSKARI